MMVSRNLHAHKRVPEQVRSNILKVAEERSESRVAIVGIRITRR